MRRNVVSGIVKQIEPVHRFLSFVTLVPIADEGWVEARVPVYMNLESEEYIGKPVDIITERTGFWGRDLEQTVESANRTDFHKVPYSLVKRVNTAYARSQDKH